MACVAVTTKMLQRCFLPYSRSILKGILERGNTTLLKHDHLGIRHLKIDTRQLCKCEGRVSKITLIGAQKCRLEVWWKWTLASHWLYFGGNKGFRGGLLWCIIETWSRWQEASVNSSTSNHPKSSHSLVSFRFTLIEPLRHCNTPKITLAMPTNVLTFRK